MISTTSFFIEIDFSRINDAVSLLRLYTIMHPDSKLADYDFSDTNPQDLIQVNC